MSTPTKPLTNYFDNLDKINKFNQKYIQGSKAYEPIPMIESAQLTRNLFKDGKYKLGFSSFVITFLFISIYVIYIGSLYYITKLVSNDIQGTSLCVKYIPFLNNCIKIFLIISLIPVVKDIRDIQDIYKQNGKVSVLSVIHLVLYGTLLGLFYYSWNISTNIQNEKLCATFSSTKTILLYRYCLTTFVGVSWFMLLIQWIILYKSDYLHNINKQVVTNEKPIEFVKKTLSKII